MSAVLDSLQSKRLKLQVNVLKRYTDVNTVVTHPETRDDTTKGKLMNEALTDPKYSLFHSFLRWRVVNAVQQGYYNYESMLQTNPSPSWWQVNFNYKYSNQPNNSILPDMTDDIEIRFSAVNRTGKLAAQEKRLAYSYPAYQMGLLDGSPIVVRASVLKLPVVFLT